MPTKEQNALEQLVAKLSAVRKTLRGEERKMLDQMVQSATFEITPHASSVKSHGFTQGQQLGKKHVEVELHSSKLESQQVESANQSATQGKVSRASQTMRVTLDNKSRNYECNIE